MATDSEDVLRRVDWLEYARRRGLTSSSTAEDVFPLIRGLARALREVRAERDKYHDALIARHGGEPIALLAELDEARADTARLTEAIKSMQKYLLNSGCECEPQIGFTCGSCRLVEIGDAAMAGRGEVKL